MPEHSRSPSWDTHSAKASEVASAFVSVADGVHSSLGSPHSPGACPRQTRASVPQEGELSLGISACSTREAHALSVIVSGSMLSDWTHADPLQSAPPGIAFTVVQEPFQPGDALNDVATDPGAAEHVAVLWAAHVVEIVHVPEGWSHAHAPHGFGAFGSAKPTSWLTGALFGQSGAFDGSPIHRRAGSVQPSS
jgi:hypothetical protein